MLGDPPLQGANLADEIGRHIDGIDADGRQTRMGLEPMGRYPEAELALMRGDRLHQRRFTHNAQARPDRCILEQVKQPPDADTADFLIIGKSEMNGRLERRFHRPLRHRKAAGNEAFHVGAAPPVKIAAAPREFERVRRPGLALDRYDIRVPRQNNSRNIGRPDHCPQIGFPAIFIVHQRRGNSEG